MSAVCLAPVISEAVDLTGVKSPAVATWAEESWERLEKERSINRHLVIGAQQ